MEGRVLVSVTLLSCGQSAEVLDGLGNGLAVQSDDDSAHRLIAVGDVEENLVGDLGALDGFSCLGEESESDGDDQQHRHDEALHGEHLDVQLMGLILRLWIVAQKEFRGTFGGKKEEEEREEVEGRDGARISS